MSIHLKNVSKRFGRFTAVDNVSLQVPDGALLALLGPPGSGKTTLLRIIAGLEVADSGSVLQQDEDITGVAARDRKMGFVFQHYALFKHMTIEDNIGFALRVRGVPKSERRDRVAELLHLIRLDGYGSRFPSQLSGGQRQRVALARALAARPKVLLLDEPFGALDAKVRQELRGWIRRLHEEIDVTSVFVTHDQEEAFEVADHVVVMNKGRIEQTGSPAEVFEHPANAFVMDFLGDVNVYDGHVQRGRALVSGTELACPDYLSDERLAATVYVRPHEITIDHHRNGTPGFDARVLHLHRIGARARIELRSIESDLLINAEIAGERLSELALKCGDTVHVSPRRARVFTA